MKNTKMLVKTKSKSYPIYFGDNLIIHTSKLLKKNLPNVKKIYIFCDRNVPLPLLKKLNKSLNKYNLKIYRFTVSEKIKNFKFAYHLIEKLIYSNFNRSDCVIAFGGGIVGDLTAFVSNLTKRGTQFINIPTTLLAQVDASLGGKTAVNSKQGKNLIGTFYQPNFVIIDTSLLKSLPYSEMIGGYGEILKHALILDKKFFFWLSKNAEMLINNNKKVLRTAIIKSCKIKSKIINIDEEENDLRMVLNFGHTFAHGFEGAKNFSKNFNHGQAVLLGMLTASELSYRKKILSLKDLTIIKKHYVELNLPMKISKFFKKNEMNRVVSFMKKDKKNSNDKINIILLRSIGKVLKPKSFKIKDIEIKRFLYSLYKN